MSDPIFTTRTELEAWAIELPRFAQMHQKLGARGALLEALATIRRVTLAHLHLPETPTEPTP